MQYACGDIGASGVGTVFYANSTAFPCGADMTSKCNYLEVAPQIWNGTLADCIKGCGYTAPVKDKTSDWGSAGIGTGRGYAYCIGSGKEVVIPNASGTLIGTGYPNTSAMLTLCKSGDAAEQVRGYTGGGMTDWSLPSQDELNALYYYTGRNAIGGFAAYHYWSSSQKYKYTAWFQNFSNGNQAEGRRDYTFGVRPVRAF